MSDVGMTSEDIARDPSLCCRKIRQAQMRRDEYCTLCPFQPVPEQAGGWYGIAYAEGERATWLKAAEMAEARAREHRQASQGTSREWADYYESAADEAEALAAAYRAKAER